MSEERSLVESKKRMEEGGSRELGKQDVAGR